MVIEISVQFKRENFRFKEARRRELSGYHKEIAAPFCVLILKL